MPARLKEPERTSRIATRSLVALAVAVAAHAAIAGRPSRVGQPRIPEGLIVLQGAQVPRKFDKSFTGTIGNNLRVRMDLSADNGTVHGQYFYERIGTAISLDGKISPKGDFSLSELNDEGKPTGHFSGSAVSRSAAGKTQFVLSGTWSSADGNKSLPFSLAEELINLGPGLDIVSKAIKQENKKPKYDIDVSYPQITGSAGPGVAAFNHETEALARKSIGEFKKGVTGPDSSPSDSETGSDISMGYEVRLATPDLISVSFGISEYSVGAAHPNGYSVAINYDFKSNRRLTLSDLFLPGKPYLQFISRYAIGKVKSRQGNSPDLEWINRGAGPKAENYKNWNLTSTGIEITFDAYQVASYAEGPQLVFMPYSELKPFINPDGPLAPLVH